ncbi:MAG: polyphenol oxidase family protein [Treponema sp.]|nr:polyphenol oxidase family protein [Treponema sp.]
MRLEVIGLGPRGGDESAIAVADPGDGGRENCSFAEFHFPLPKAASLQAVPPRALLSLRDSGSMRYLRDRPNPARRQFFACQGLDPGLVVGMELHHTRRLKIVERRAVGRGGGDGEEIDADDLPGEDAGDGGPDGAEGRDGIVFVPTVGSVAAPRASAFPGLAPSARPVAATVTVADCMPIWLWDAASGAWGILHSGWKGTGILDHAVRAILERCGGSPATISAILGPAIGVCCYDVPSSRAAIFENEFGAECVDRSGPRPRLDIRAANLAIARRLDIGAVLSVDVCTSCDSSLGSYRREGAAGFTRMVAACVPVGA